MTTYSTGEAAKLLGVVRCTLVKWCKSGLLFDYIIHMETWL